MGRVLADEHGVWLAETQRLWLRDPDTLEVERGWALVEPVRGSFAVLGKDGRAGARTVPGGEPCPAVVVDIDAAARLVGVRARRGRRGRRRAHPAGHPGRAVGRARRHRAGAVARAVEHYVRGLVGPDARSRSFVLGAEGMALTGPDQLWVVSESGPRLYQEKGRPMTPCWRASTPPTSSGGWSRRARPEHPSSQAQRSSRTLEA